VLLVKSALQHWGVVRWTSVLASVSVSLNAVGRKTSINAKLAVSCISRRAHLELLRIHWLHLRVTRQIYVVVWTSGTTSIGFRLIMMAQRYTSSSRSLTFGTTTSLIWVSASHVMLQIICWVALTVRGRFDLAITCRMLLGLVHDVLTSIISLPGLFLSKLLHSWFANY
jgi:hypothetical protein